ncbi:hypothetical protein FRUB_08931 [Fimbriiglobus ruber]|uniref:Uncharacterized protein n=1 Tax=Fimbriiglobus ruber TaxID=1908690 RepID=A0A225DCV4_9BACT|nr:hypothetical protein FRUB_08931 [Fimbriiglobus ruber]
MLGRFVRSLNLGQIIENTDRIEDAVMLGAKHQCAGHWLLSEFNRG